MTQRTGHLLFEGRAVPFEPGDTVASALWRAGVVVFSRGPKYHRPRGPFCLAGSCAQCHMRIDDEPNVPACEAPARDGLQVERQNVLGSGDFDLLRAADFVYPRGLDHHHLMTRPRVLNELTGRVVRHLAGVGEVPGRVRAVRPADLLERELVVVGAGPSGLGAAVQEAAGGVRPLVLEALDEVGGRVVDGFEGSRSPDEVERLAREVFDAAEVRLGVRAAAVYPADDGGWDVLARGPDGLIRVRTRRVVLAPGGLEAPVPFGNADLPGVVAGRGLVRFLRRHDVLPARRVVVAAFDRDADVVVRALEQRGVAIAAVLDAGGVVDPDAPWPVLAALPWRANGLGRVDGLVARDAEGREHAFECDLIAVVPRLSPAHDLAAQAGVAMHYVAEAGGFVPQADAEVDGIRLEGRVIGAAQAG